MQLPADLDVENVAVLVGDAVRYDYAVDRLADRGLTYKTVASSLHTPTSFASMLSGQYPTQHGVYGFHQRMPTDDHLFSLDDAGYTTGFNDGETNASEWLAQRQQVFGWQERYTLDEVETPFVWVDRDFGGHAPYNVFGQDGRRNELTTQGEYFKAHAGDNDHLSREYADAVESWLARVDDMLATLERRGIRDETLVVLMSDHGEILGEHGHLGHDYPATPELVYVPTTFVHPDIEPGVVEEGVARHIDLAPTVLDYLGEDLGVELPGHALQSDGTVTRAISYYNRALNDYLTRLDGLGFDKLDVTLSERLPETRFEIESVWDRDGGYAFNRSAKHQRALLYLFRTFVLPHGRSIIRQRAFKRAYDTLAGDVTAYGRPGFTEAEAEAILDRRLVSKVETSYEYDFDAASEQQLEDLGYL